MLTTPTHQQAYNNGMAVLGLAVERPWLSLGGPFLFIALMGLEPPLLSMKVFLSLDGPRHHFGSPVPHSACCYLQYILQLRRRGTGKFYHMNDVMGKRHL